MTPVLRELAELYGLQLTYEDGFRVKRESPAMAVMAALQQLGAPLHRAEDAAEALRLRHMEIWREALPQTAVAWEGERSAVTLRLPMRLADSAFEAEIHLEDGDRRHFAFQSGALESAGASNIEGVSYITKLLPLPEDLPLGYHRISVHIDGERWECFVIRAPRQAHLGERNRDERYWGALLPLYSLHTKRSWGAGDFTDLERMSEWLYENGHGFAASLPFTACFLDVFFDPSPYFPASRLFWNELYIDIERAPELGLCAEARERMESEWFRRRLQELRSSRLVDYEGLFPLKRDLLELLAKSFFENAGDERRGAFERYIANHEDAESYARFRAACVKSGSPWQDWPQRQRDGNLQPGDYDEPCRQFHLYSQFLADEQLSALAALSRRAGPGFYLDLPIGCSARGYDPWRHQGLFAENMSIGAPPDSFFAHGQSWGFPPMRPDALQISDFKYLVDVFRRHFQRAGVLRIDHILGFHRLFWIPSHLGAENGVYVTYPHEQIYAIVCLESARAGSMVVGEDLGTIPPAVREVMATRGINRMFVMPFEIENDDPPALKQPPSMSVASLNTHDMPTFEAWWTESDIQVRLGFNSIGEELAQKDRHDRAKARHSLLTYLMREGLLDDSQKENTAEIMTGLLSALARSSARLMFVNIEDLWLEPEQQNLPGTGSEAHNWRNRARHGLEEIEKMPEVAKILNLISSQRATKPFQP